MIRGPESPELGNHDGGEMLDGPLNLNQTVKRSLITLDYTYRVAAVEQLRVCQNPEKIPGWRLPQDLLIMFTGMNMPIITSTRQGGARVIKRAMMNY